MHGDHEVDEIDLEGPKSIRVSELELNLRLKRSGQV